MTAQIVILPDGTRVNAPGWWIDRNTINRARAANRQHRNTRLENADARIRQCPHCDERTLGKHHCERTH